MIKEPKLIKVPTRLETETVEWLRAALEKNPDGSVIIDHRYAVGGGGEKRSRELLEKIWGTSGTYQKITHGRPTLGMGDIIAGKEFVIRATFKVRDVLNHYESQQEESA